MKPITETDLEPEHHQLIILALVELAIARPGWHRCCEDCAARFEQGLTLFWKFMETRAQPLTDALQGNDGNFMLDPSYPPSFVEDIRAGLSTNPKTSRTTPSSGPQP
jgi:hypothetical protein